MHHANTPTSTTPLSVDGEFMICAIAELIGPDWSDLDEPERECLTMLHAEGIRLNPTKYLAANTAANRRAELAVI